SLLAAAFPLRRVVGTENVEGSQGRAVAANSRADSLDPHRLIHWGQQAARAGDRAVAYRLFAKAVGMDPSNEEAWLWRAASAANTDETRRCLEQVLRLNPNNQQARQGLRETAPTTSRLARSGAAAPQPARHLQRAAAAI